MESSIHSGDHEPPQWALDVDAPLDGFPVVDSNNAVYFASKDERIHGVSEDGQNLWLHQPLRGDFYGNSRYVYEAGHQQ